MMATLILVTVVGLFLWDRRKNQPIPNQWWFAAAIGIIAGVAIWPVSFPLTQFYERKS